ncbi:NADP-dependent malic enzyme [Candidatus Gracilibacteria bacterium]|nr:NADP-dependent malic enzyme [Candidatus Gracilibacteria bacterium]
MSTNYYESSLIEHKKYAGKVQVSSRVPLETRDDMSTYYSPGVAQPCLEIAKNPESAYDYTRKGRTIAVVSDGTAVLGLGNIGGLAGLPVMEGKAILFKEFGGVDAIPLVLKTQDPDEIISIVENIAPTFGGINLEDISAPNCFYIEDELKKRLNIPVFHDDQHGTAIVVLAGLINALKLTGKEIGSIKIVIAGAGAAGLSIAKLLQAYGAKHIIITDSKGAIHSKRTDLNQYKTPRIASNLNDQAGTLAEVLVGADVFVGVSRPNLISSNEVRTMNQDPIIFALSNPEPEIMPEEAYAGGAAIVATGRSDFPNQVNNVLAFPGLFKGVLEARIPQIEHKHLIAVAKALADYVKTPTKDEIIPGALDKAVAQVVADAVKKA